MAATGSALMDDKLVLYPIELERHLMEGSYSKVWAARCNPPLAEYAIFLEQLMTTIRNEIASCGEKAYTSLPVADAATLLFFDQMQDLLAFAAQVRADASRTLLIDSAPAGKSIPPRTS